MFQTCKKKAFLKKTPHFIEQCWLKNMNISGSKLNLKAYRTYGSIRNDRTIIFISVLVHMKDVVLL